MSGKHPRRRKRRKGRKPPTATQSAVIASPPAPLAFSAPSISVIRDRFQLLKQRANG